MSQPPTDQPSSRREMREARNNAHHSPLRVWGTRLATVILVWGIYALIISFIAQPFKVPSASMKPLVNVGDRIIVNKTNDPHNLHRGDVIVFSDPNHWLPTTHESAFTKVLIDLRLTAGGNHLLKRVIGLPGDHISCTSATGHVMLNGQTLTEPYVAKDVSPCAEGAGVTNFSITVPKDSVWVMGDNRGDSADSREHDMNSGGKLGSVPMKDVVGRVTTIMWPVSAWGKQINYPFNTK